MLTSGALLTGSVSVICITAYALLARVWVKDSDSPLAFAILYTATAALIASSLTFIEPWTFTDVSWSVAGLLVLASVLYGLYDATQFSARKYVEASTLALIMQLAPAVTLALSFAILREPFTVAKVAGAGAIIAGNLVALYRSGSHLTSRGIMFGLAAAGIAGTAYVVDKMTFEHFPVPLYTMSVYVIPLFVVAALYASTGGTLVRLAAEGRRISWRIFVLSGLGVAGYYMILKTFAVADASVAVPLVYSSTVLTALGGVFLLDERVAVMQKVVGSLLVFAGILLLRI